MGFLTLDEKIKYSKRTDPKYAAKFTFWTFVLLMTISAIIIGFVAELSVSPLEYVAVCIPVILTTSLIFAGSAYFRARTFQGGVKAYKARGFGDKTAIREALADRRAIDARGRNNNAFLDLGFNIIGAALK